MNSQLTSNVEALRLFFTDDVYLVNDKNQSVPAEPVITALGQMEKPTNLPVTPLQTNKLPNILPPAEEPMSNKKELNFDFLGKNQKKILILVNDNSNKVSSSQGTELLRKLVKAIELTNNDFALVNYANYLGTAFEDLRDFFKCELVLSFGVEMRALGLLEQPLNQLLLVDGTRFVFAKNLHDLDSDQLSKKILWGSLQQLR